MKMIDPTYLRTIHDGLLSGAVHKDNASALPLGLVGIYEEALPPTVSVKERKKFLEFFSSWALLKKEVSAEFVLPLLEGWTEDQIIDYIAQYSKWFNSPVSGKYVLYHERLRTFILQKVSAQQFEKCNEQIIHRCQVALQAKVGDEWELYALEYLSTHLLIQSIESNHSEDLKALSYNTTHWNRQIEISKGFEWSKRMLNDMMLWASKYDDDEVIVCALNKVDLHHMEQNDAPRIVELVAQNDIETALQRIESFGGNDKEGLQRKFILYMLCLMELTLLDSKDKPFRKEAIEKIIGVIFGGVFDEKEFPIDELPSDVLFQMSLEWERLSIDYCKFYQYKSNWDWELSIIQNLNSVLELAWFQNILPDFAMRCSFDRSYWLYGNAIKNLGEHITKDIYYEIAHSGGFFTRPLWLVNYYLRTGECNQIKELLDDIHEKWNDRNLLQELLLEADLLVIEYKISNGILSENEVPSEFFEIGEILEAFKYQFIHSNDFSLHENYLEELFFRYGLVAIQFDYEVNFILTDYLEIIEILIRRGANHLNILKNRARFILLDLLSGSNLENLKIPLHDLIPEVKVNDSDFVWEIIWELEYILNDYSDSKMDFTNKLDVLKKNEYLAFVKECFLNLSECVKVRVTEVSNIQQSNHVWNDEFLVNQYKSLLKKIEYNGVNCDSLSVFKFWIDDSFERQKNLVLLEKERSINAGSDEQWIFNLDLNSELEGENDLIHHSIIEQFDLIQFKENLFAKEFDSGFELIQKNYSLISKDQVMGFSVVVIKYSRRFRRVGYHSQIFSFIADTLNFGFLKGCPVISNTSDISDFLFLFKYLLGENLKLYGTTKFDKEDPHYQMIYKNNVSTFFDYFDKELNNVIENLTDCYPLFLNFVMELLESKKFKEELNFLLWGELGGLSWPFALHRRYCQFLIENDNYIFLESALDDLELLKGENKRNQEEFDKLILTIGYERDIQKNNAFYYQFKNALYSDICRSNVIEGYIRDLTISSYDFEIIGEVLRERFSSPSFELSESEEFRNLLKLLPYRKIETNQIERLFIPFFTNSLGASLKLRFKNLEETSSDYTIEDLDQTYLNYLIRLNQKWAIDIKNSFSAN